MRFPTGGIAHEPQGMIRCDSEADSIVWMEEDKTRRGECILLRVDDCSGMNVRSGVFCCASVFARRRLALNLVFGAFLLAVLAGVVLRACKEKSRKLHHTIESKSSGQGASPYRWYSPRAARLIRCNSEADSDSLDGRRGEMQGEVYPPADSVTALGCHTHSGAFCLRKSFACHFHTLNPWFRVFFWR